MSKENKDEVEIHCPKGCENITADNKYLEGIAALYPSIIIYTCYDKANGYVRRLHGVPDLIWDDALAHDAREYAYYLALADAWHHSSFLDENGIKYGECLYRSAVEDISPDMTLDHRGHTAVYYWCREVTKYDYCDPDQYNHDKEKVEEIGHFTQLVWDNTNRFGLAISVRPDLGRVYIVARYSKAGNNAYGNEPFREHVRRQTTSEGSPYIPNMEELKPPNDIQPKLDVSR